MVMRPAPANHGIWFRRTDLRRTGRHPRTRRTPSATTLGTTLVKDGAKVSTIEHLLSALRRPRHRQRDHRTVVRRSADHGRQRRARSCSCCSPPASRSRSAPKRSCASRRREGRGRRQVGAIRPVRRFPVNFEIEFDHPVFKRRSQVALDGFSTTTFLREVSRPRTFGFMRDLEILRSRNLALAATSTTRSCSTTTGSSTRTGCVTRTSS